MLWESNSNNEDDPNDSRWMPNRNPIFPQVTPVLVPQPGGRNVQQPVPVVVPDVEELKEQFQQQQNMLAQIKETIKENESQLSSKEKKVEAYANRLSQIRARAKKTDGREHNVQSKPVTSTVTAATTTTTTTSRPLSRKSSKENLEKETDGKDKSSKAKLSPKGKINELKKKLEENKLKVKERAGKEVSETKKIESMVENLRMQLDERHLTIQELQKLVEDPPASDVKSEAVARRNKGKSEGRMSATKSTQTTKIIQSDESTEIIALQNRIYELETNILDLEENLKEKESVIEARTQAVTLLSQDMSMKGKNTLESLEETRQEMRTMQNNFIIIENQLKKELVEKDSELSSYEVKFRSLESTNSELLSRNTELVEKLAEMEKKYAELDTDKKSLSESIVQVRSDDEIMELNKKINALNKELEESNKSMIKMKLEHKNKVKHLNKTIEKLKETSDDKAEILRLQNKLDEFELVRESWQNKIAELEEEKVNEKKLKDQINELEAGMRQQCSEIEKHLQTIANLELEKHDLLQSNQDQSILIENLYVKIQNLEQDNKLSEEKDAMIAKLSERLQSLEDEYKIKLEDMKSEHKKEIEALESCQNVRSSVGSDRKELEEYRISNEINNVHVEEQIEMLVREKQQLLEKLKSLSGVSSTESFTFETVEHSDIQGPNESRLLGTELEAQSNIDSGDSEETKNREIHLQRITDEQQKLINELQATVKNERDKTSEYEMKIEKLEESIRDLEQINNRMKSEASVVEGVDVDTSKTQKSHANVKNKIRKMQTELAESKRTIKEQNERLEELNLKLEEKEQLIKNYIEKIELFEKDDWGRENDWKTSQDDFECMQELQKKCLTLENSLIDMNEDCERLRKENIEVVHLLSEEKVKRKKLLEKLQLRDDYSNMELEEIVKTPTEMTETTEETSEMATASLDESCSDDPPLPSVSSLYENVSRLIETAETLVDKLDRLEVKLREEEENGAANEDLVSSLQEAIKESQSKLEWSNIVLASKETEIFRLQNLLEDNSKAIEDLEQGIKEANKKLVEKNNRIKEFVAELRKKEVQVEELSANFEKLQESVVVENERAASNEVQLKLLMETVQEMEVDAMKKEGELKEIQAILAEKNLDIHNLKQWLEQVNSDLTYGYKEHLENMDKYLKDKEVEFDAVLAEKTELEEAKTKLMSMNEDISRQRDELVARNKELEKTLSAITETAETSKKDANVGTEPEETGEEEVEKSHDYKMKIKKLAANLKKKVQNEKDLLQQIKEYEEYVEEKDAKVQNLEKELAKLTEGLAAEKKERDLLKAELAGVLSAKKKVECENMNLKEQVEEMEAEHEREMQKLTYKNHQIEGQAQKIQKQYEMAYLKLEEHKGLLKNMECRLIALSETHTLQVKGLQAEVAVGRETQEDMKTMLIETCSRYESEKSMHEKVRAEKSEVEKVLKEREIENCELKTDVDRLKLENSSIQAKLQEQLAVVESLENDLSQARDQLKRNEDMVCDLEERRSSLEMKIEELLQRIEEDSKNLIIIEDLTNQIQCLLASEQNLKAALKTAEETKKGLEQERSDLIADKAKLEKDVKEFGERVNHLNEELKRMHDVDAEKTETVEFLAKEAEKLKEMKMDNKQKCAEIERLNKDIQLLEADLKENVENSKSVENTLKQKIEELRSENANLVQRSLSLLEAKRQQRSSGKESSKGKKSADSRREEAAAIKELEAKAEEYAKPLKMSEDGMKAEGEKVLEVASQAREVVSLGSPPEKRLEEKATSSAQGASRRDEDSEDDSEESGESESSSDHAPKGPTILFIPPPKGDPTAKGWFFDPQRHDITGSADSEIQMSVNADSLMWDDGWGTDGHLEEDYMSSKKEKNDAVDPEDYPKMIQCLEDELRASRVERKRLEEELRVVQMKFAKALGKLRAMNVVLNKSQVELKKLKNELAFGGLDTTMIEELKSQIKALELREKELMKNLESAKLEKEGLLKRIEVLGAGNEKFMEMKERQDNEIELWETKNRELLKEIQELRGELRERGEAGKGEADESAVASENSQLKNRVEGLEWEICELKELLEEKQELLEVHGQGSPDAEEGLKLRKEVAELTKAKEALEGRLAEEEKKSRDAVEELQEKVNALASENDTLQEILGEMKKSAEKAKTPRSPTPVPDWSSSQDAEVKVFDYFKAAPANDVFSSVFSEGTKEARPPVVEAPIQRKVVQPVAMESSSVRELESLRQERDSVRQQLESAHTIVEAMKGEMDKMIAAHEKALSSAEDERDRALLNVRELERRLAARLQDSNRMIEQLSELERELKRSNVDKEDAFKSYDEKAKECVKLRLHAHDMTQALQAMSEDIDRAASRINHLENALRMKCEDVNNAARGVTVLETQLEEKTAESSRREETINELERVMRVKMDEIDSLMLKLGEVEREAKKTESELSDMKKLNEELMNAQKAATEGSSSAEGEIHGLVQSLNEERARSEELRKLAAEKENELVRQSQEAKALREELTEAKKRLEEAVRDCERQRSLAEEYCEAKEKLEDVASNLRTELETVNLELQLSKNEMEENRRSSDTAVTELEAMRRARDVGLRELDGLRTELTRKSAEMEKAAEEAESREARHAEEVSRLQSALAASEAHIESLKSELQVKDNDIFELSQALEEMRGVLGHKDVEIEDLRQSLVTFRDEINSFRNFEKQVKELRMAQIKQTGSAVQVTAEGDPDFTNWTEHELAELNTRLQSDLDTALYMLHERDLRCDELTFELMQLLEERDTLQLRLSTAIRINEDLRSLTNSENNASGLHQRQETSQDLADQSLNAQQRNPAAKLPEENLRELAQKISQLHSISYIRDKTIQDDTMQRHRDQMTLLNRVSDTDANREPSTPPPPSKNWIGRGKNTPKVMHV